MNESIVVPCIQIITDNGEAESALLSPATIPISLMKHSNQNSPRHTRGEISGGKLMHSQNILNNWSSSFQSSSPPKRNMEKVNTLQPGQE